MTKECIARKLEVNGIVQGVGFRPFVYQLATQNRLKGEVANTPAGVSIHVEGFRGDILSFSRSLSENCPPLAKITAIAVHSDRVRGLNDFSIVKSRGPARRSALISPDVSVCEDCLHELFHPGDRRYRYPFINCTNCGPRYTIIADVPYDRSNTSMKRFQMCPACQAEYDDPLNRRFHAQPNACGKCGPHVALYDNTGRRLAAPNPVAKAAALLKKGSILAVKGLGGFHLVVDAANGDAVLRLRKRKHRPEKPLAVMSFDIARIRRYAQVEPAEEALLTSIPRPIVLLRKREPNPLSAAVSPRNNCFGTMLPYTPLHYLLLKCDFIALVMTSGNMPNEPMCIDNENALVHLAPIADYFLTHNRDIYLRSDDSIVKQTAGAVRFVRRSRGYVPVPVYLKKSVPQILACGGAQKNVICLTKEEKAFLSQHIGDLENPGTYEFFQRTIDHLKRILDIDPEYVAHDLHPDYLSTRYADTLTNVQKLPVQHHHAHIVSCMAENRIDGPVIGLAFDGTGYGTDGAVWGGEVLVAEPDRFQRAAHLSYVPMPGGVAAIREPWRMAASYLYDAFGEAFWNLELPLLKAAALQELHEKKLKIIVEMISKRINSPYTSSLGRLFDGIAAILGLRTHASFEGQAAMELETLARGRIGGERTTPSYDYEWRSGASHRIQLRPIVREVAKDVERGTDPSEISRKFHGTLIRMFSALCGFIGREWGLNRVVLSGGVFQNAILLSGLKQALAENNFQVVTHTRVPANDGGIALGQVLVAAAVAGNRP